MAPAWDDCSFELEHKRAGEPASAPWTTLTSDTSATFDVEGLAPGTRYVFRGRAGTWTAGGADGQEKQLQVMKEGARGRAVGGSSCSASFVVSTNLSCGTEKQRCGVHQRHPALTASS